MVTGLLRDTPEGKQPRDTVRTYKQNRIRGLLAGRVLETRTLSEYRHEIRVRERTENV